MIAMQNKIDANVSGSFSRHRQRGIATIMILLLVGLSLTAAVLGAMHYTRSAQDQLLSVHSQTQAQMRVWTGAETVREFLEQLRKNGQLPTLADKVHSAASTPITIDGLAGVSAQFIEVDSATDPKQITAVITGVAAESTKGESSSTLKVVYALNSPSETPKTPKQGGVTYNKSVKLSGGITVETDPGSSFVISVMGDVTTDGNSIKGVSVLKSTGSISIGSGSSFDKLEANCDVRLTGSVSAATINARRNVCLDGSAAGTKAINANGSVFIKSSYDTNGDIAAIGNPTDVDSCHPPGTAEDSSNGIAQTCDAPDPFYVVDMREGNAKSVKANGSVALLRKHIGDLQAEGDLRVDWGSGVDSGAITGTVIGNGADSSSIKLARNSTGLTVSIPSVTRVTLSSYVIDAYDYQAIANYVFKVDANGYKKVTVNNVSGIANGEYFLGSYAATNNDKVDYLCAKLDPSSTPGGPKCLGPYTPSLPPTICQGYSPQNACFGYDKGVWSINGKSMAQGIAWFEGSLSVGSGTYYNTFIATKNISTSGSDNVYAPNFAGYDGTYNSVSYAPTGICENANFPAIYPKQFCDTSGKAYLQNAVNGIGNYVFIAGSVKGGKYTDVDSYDGGNIDTGASTKLYGSVKAGNEFTSGGSTTISGYVTALAAGASTHNSMGGSTTFKLKLSELPPTFSPADTETTSGGAPTTSNDGVKIQWSRYL